MLHKGDSEYGAKQESTRRIGAAYGAASTPFFAVSEMPLFPGGSLYYCMLNALEGNSELSLAYGRATFATALGIAGGMSIVWALCDLSRKIAARRGAGRDVHV